MHMIGNFETEKDCIAEYNVSSEAGESESCLLPTSGICKVQDTT